MSTVTRSDGTGSTRCGDAPRSGHNFPLGLGSTRCATTTPASSSVTASPSPSSRLATDTPAPPRPLTPIPISGPTRQTKPVKPSTSSSASNYAAPYNVSSSAPLTTRRASTGRASPPGSVSDEATGGPSDMPRETSSSTDGYRASLHARRHQPRVLGKQPTPIGGPQPLPPRLPSSPKPRYWRTGAISRPAWPMLGLETPPSETRGPVQASPDGHGPHYRPGRAVVGILGSCV